MPLNNVSLHFINGLNINFEFDKNLRINNVLPHLKLLFNSITAATEEFSQFTPARLLVQPQVFPDGGGVKSQHGAGVGTFAVGADGAEECVGVHHVVVVGGELVAVLHHHVLHHLLDGVAVGEAAGVEFQARFALESLIGVTLLDVPDGL